MTRALTKKQQTLLDQLDRESLLDIVQQVISENAKVRKWLINGWLSAPDDVIKRLQTEYFSCTKGNLFYEYDEADEFFRELTDDIVLPLAKHVEARPAQIEAMTEKLLLDVERLFEHVDSSSGSWMDYTSGLFDIWIQALAAQKERKPEDIAQAIFNMAQNYDWFDVNKLAEKRGVLGSDTLRALADRFTRAGETDNAVTVLLQIRDVDAALALVKQGARYRPQNMLKLARLLIDDLRADEAIVLLHIAEAGISDWSADFILWGELMVTALLEEGQGELARETAINAFSRSIHSRFWFLYVKAGGDESTGLSVFLPLAAKGESEQAIRFLSETQHYALLSDIICGTDKAGLNICLPTEIVGSFWRTLSSTLYKQGDAQAAVILRRRLAEYSIGRGSGQHYTYAANDAKKAIDYCAELESSASFLSSQNWLESLYKTHYRKYSLWKIMQEKVVGISISKEKGLIWQNTELNKG